MKIGIVGHEAAKFTEFGRAQAMLEVGRIIGIAAVKDGTPTVVSGHCHLGGVDIWAEEAAKHLGCPLIVHAPEGKFWPAYKKRNLLIAQDSDEVHVVVVDKLPEDFEGMRHDLCYHCNTTDHVKSGACWTAKQAQKLGKLALWHVIKQEPK